MHKKSKSCAFGGTPSAGSQNTNVNLGMKLPPKGKAAPGKTSMGIPPMNQKAKNIQKLSSMAKDSKKVKGSDKYS
jgi:hypothetical protein